MKISEDVYATCGACGRRGELWCIAPARLRALVAVADAAKSVCGAVTLGTLSHLQETVWALERAEGPPSS